MNSSASKHSTTIPQDVIDDLCSRFIINIPQEERKDLIRVCFHIELAHWFYIDYYCTEANNTLPKAHQSDLDRTIERWRDYKMAVPTYGAILLDEDLDHVLLVQGFWARSSWGFPKGKVNADEDPVVCACREVLEETGYDCSSAISPKDYIELHIQDTLIRLYIVTGVDMETVFKPMTRCEIKNCSWFKISDLPNSRKVDVKIDNKALRPSAFFMTIPFIKPLRKWIFRRRKSLNMTDCSLADIEIETECSAVLEEVISSASSTQPTQILQRTPRQQPQKHAQHQHHQPQQQQQQQQQPQKQQQQQLQHQQHQQQQQQPLDPQAKQLINKLKSQQQQQQPQSQRPRFWSSTWQSVKIDWTDILRELGAHNKNNNNNNNRDSSINNNQSEREMGTRNNINNVSVINKLLAIHS